MSGNPEPATLLMVLTDRRMAAAAGHDLDDVVATAAASGATAVVLREKDLAPADRRALAVRLRAVTAAAHVALVVAGDVGLATAVGADGAHLAGDAAWPDDDARRALRGAAPGPAVVGRSCHTVADLQAAARRHADYVTYSPVFATASKPGYGPAVGLDGLAAGRLALDPAGEPDRSMVGRLRRSYLAPEGAPRAHRVTLVALGGIGPGRAGACLRAGADGVALMGEVMRARDPGAVVAAAAAEVDVARWRGRARG
jgi:thiamine-phosphate pyrophosphorylase